MALWKKILNQSHTAASAIEPLLVFRILTPTTSGQPFNICLSHDNSKSRQSLVSSSSNQSIWNKWFLVSQTEGWFRLIYLISSLNWIVPSDTGQRVSLEPKHACSSSSWGTTMTGRWVESSSQQDTEIYIWLVKILQKNKVGGISGRLNKCKGFFLLWPYLKIDQLCQLSQSGCNTRA